MSHPAAFKLKAVEFAKKSGNGRAVSEVEVTKKLV